MRVSSARSFTVLLVTLCGGCLMAPSMPPRSNPGTGGGNDTAGSAVALGMTTNFGATLVQDGEEREVVYWPRRTIAALPMIAVVARRPVSPRCDGGGQISMGRTGIDARCGIGSAARAISLSTGAEWLWWQGLVGRTELQAGARSEDFMAFVSTGLTYSAFGHKIPLEGMQLSSGGLLSGPPDPSVVVRQKEVAWSSSALFGVKAGGYKAPFLFFGLTFDRPLTTTSPSFECLGCDESPDFSDFDPGVRMGAMVGLSTGF